MIHYQKARYSAAQCSVHHLFLRKPAVTKAHVQASDQEKDDAKETGRPKNY